MVPVVAAGEDSFVVDVVEVVEGPFVTAEIDSVDVGLVVGAGGVSGALGEGLVVTAVVASGALVGGLATDTMEDSFLMSCGWADPASRPVTSDPLMSLK